MSSSCAAPLFPRESPDLRPATDTSSYSAFLDRKRAEFAALAPRYELQCLVASGGRIQSLRQQIAALAVSHLKGPVLELCCGTGGVTAELARLFDDVTGVDLSPDMLARAKRRLQRERLTNVHLHEADVSTLRFPAASFSAVVISLGLHELPLPIRNQIYAQSARWLKPGGRFVFCDYVRPQNPLLIALARWLGPVLIEKEHFDEYWDYSIDPHLVQNGFTPVERHRRFGSGLEVSAWALEQRKAAGVLTVAG